MGAIVAFRFNAEVGLPPETVALLDKVRTFAAEADGTGCKYGDDI